MARTAQEVFEDHLALAQAGDVETDIYRNFSEDCVLLTSEGVFHGHEGIRKAAASLARQLPDPVFHYHTRLVEGDLAFLEWTGYSFDVEVTDGADSYFIREGKIRGMTAHYTFSRK